MACATRSRVSRVRCSGGRAAKACSKVACIRFNDSESNIPRTIAPLLALPVREVAAGRVYAPAIRQAQAAGAKTLRQIAAALNGRGIGTARGGKWAPQAVANVLQRIG